MYQTIRLNLIDGNPYRDTARNPMRPEHIAHLVTSIKSTEFWANVVVRPHPEKPGRYQLTYGHVRLLAARQCGIKEAEFQVRDVADDQMIKMMAAENVTQFGKDSFATYSEATIAAVNYIMSEVLTDPKAAQELLSGFGAKQDHTVQNLNFIREGGCPGEPIIVKFFGGTLGATDIRLALQTYKDTGELSEWHAKHNPQAKPEPTPRRTVSAEAIAKFDKTHHVDTFVHAVKQSGVRVEDQAAIADEVVSRLRVRHQPGKPGAKPPLNEKMTGANIRVAVGKAVAGRAQSSAQRKAAERFAAMTSVEADLKNIKLGLTRAVHGFHNLTKALELFGKLEIENLSNVARDDLVAIRESLAQIQRLMEASLRVYPKLEHHISAKTH